MKIPNKPPIGTVKSVPTISPESIQPKLIKLPEVIDITGLSKTTIYRLMRNDRFPQQVPMGVIKSAFWSNLEVYQWIAAPTKYKQKTND
tara:strand:+ start:216 stop:482 length:267 start_codon:yes stop_codon:yes gene_type:complete